SYGEYYFLGRLLSVAYTVAAVALVTLLGRRAWGSWRVGLAAGWLTAVNLSLVFHAKMVRTDSAGLFFGLLAAWLALRLLEEVNWRDLLLAAAAVGLAAASRYFGGVVGLLVGAAVLRHGWRSARSWAMLAAAGVTALAVFALVNPAMIAHPADVLADLRREARLTHLGADGFSPLGNVWWYLSEGIPVTLGLVWVVGCGGVATTIIEQRRGADRWGAWLLLGYLISFVLLISLASLHWHRWLIPVVPVILLFAAAALHFAVETVAPRLRWSHRERRLIFGLALVALMASNLVTLIQRNMQDAGEDTRLEARVWMVANLPAGSRVLQETYSAVLGGTPLVAESVRALPDEVAESFRAGGNLQPLADRGYDYVVVSSAIYDRFLAEPQRYPSEVAFYRQLFAEGNLVQEFAPSWIQSGPTLRIYKP
ncbi:MAG: glycosyltransferase family 39 protein, partial [Caldilineaceae bacterium]